MKISDSVIYGTSWRGEDPRGVANWLIRVSNEAKNALPHVSIQKIVYLAHASHLYYRKRPLVNGAFEAWEFGPVNKAIWNELKNYGRTQVTAPIEKVDMWSGEVTIVAEPKDLLVITHLEEVYSKLKDKTPSQLISITHKKNGPWDCIWDKSRTEVTLSNRISDEVTYQRSGNLVSDLNIEDKGTIEYFETPPFKSKRKPN